MNKRSIILFLASLAAAVAGGCLSPISLWFLLASLTWGALYAVLRVCFWTRKSGWLPTLAYCLAMIGGLRVSVQLFFPEVRVGSATDWSLALLFVGIVGLVVFGYEILYFIRRARHSMRDRNA